jgi:hypothetical protein
VRSTSAWLAAMLCLGLATSARAYQNPDMFAAEPARGGGGDRYFTGSLLDSYTCEVCHTSESPLPVRIVGLPEADYQLGATYHITVDWPDELPRVALTMEMTDRSGHALGSWRESNPAVLAVADHCALEADPPSGIRILDRAGPRAVVSAIDCGQQQTSLDWIAPSPTDIPPGMSPPDAWFSGALVASNRNGKLGGDSVAVFARGLSAPGAQPIAATEILARCTISQAPGAGGERHAHYCLLLLGGLLLQRTRFRRAREPRAADSARRL